MKKTRFILIISLILNIVAAYFITDLVRAQSDIPFMPKKKSVFVKKKPKSLFFMGKDLVFDILPKDSNAILFLGDSHTEHFYLQELIGNSLLKNRGISGDRLRGILKRLDPIIASQPKKIFIQAGINDLGMGARQDSIAAQYRRLISIISAGSPRTKIYVQSIFPVENKIDKPSTYCNPWVNKAVVNINAFLKANAEKQEYTFIDVYSSLVKDGKLNPAYSFDGIHLTADGYVIWADLVRPYVNE